MKRVVVVGGGTGTFVTLSALKAIPNLDLTAIVTVADSGGSTGRLRDEFGFLPVGDLRQALAALAVNEGRKKKGKARLPASRPGGTARQGKKQEKKNWIRELLLYRFSKGQGLEGHNLGNLILTALQDMTGSTARAIESASKIFRLHGHIYPVTTTPIQLVIEYADGTVEIGEHVLDDERRHGGDRIISVKTSPRAKIYSKARQAIESADAVIIGPGDLYGSIMPNLVIKGMPEAIGISRAALISVMNLMTRFTQTHNMSARDHVKAIESATNREFDRIIVNNAKITKSILSAYHRQNEHPVADDLENDPRVIRMPLVKTAPVRQNASDRVRRSYLRHDPVKLTKVLTEIIYEP